MARLATFLLLLTALPAVFATYGIYDLVKRRIPQHAGNFIFTLVNGTGDSFTISDTPGKSGVTVECTTVNACARGLYTYVTDLLSD